jgi:hypothetical protein
LQEKGDIWLLLQLFFELEGRGLCKRAGVQGGQMEQLKVVIDIA